MKIKLTQVYIKEGDETDFRLLKESIEAGDAQIIGEFFNIGWEPPFEEKVERI